ncbi:conjugal transfer protein TrbN [Pseudoduganella lurida]|uniref:conjugal transfer protein TrbN n=1 Tax=Pseudoduganella lurida TaxID=1036180 RepID=UPI0018F690A1|nr:conjugal transfer protein TrbN [Pseudoduganella lurida]
MIDLPSSDAAVMVTCSIEAAGRYRIPTHILLAVAAVENGRPGQRVANTNGSSDIGPMQFNTRYIRSLSRYGITEADVADTGCYPFHLAAWRLRRHLMQDSGDFWTRVANYHSRTPVFNQTYRRKLIARGAEWAAWLQASKSTAPTSSNAPPRPSNEWREGIRSQDRYVPRMITRSSG